LYEEELYEEELYEEELYEEELYEEECKYQSRGIAVNVRRYDFWLRYLSFLTLSFFQSLTARARGKREGKQGWNTRGDRGRTRGRRDMYSGRFREGYELHTRRLVFGYI